MDSALLIDENDIRIMNRIGQGAHGVIFEGNWKSTNGQVGYQYYLLIIVLYI